MTPTTPPKSPVDTIGEALEEARRIMLRDYPEEANDPSEYHESLDAALSALSSISTQPAQNADIDKIMEVVGGEANGAAERIAHEISEPRKALEQMCSFIRLRLCNELRVAPLPSHTEGLEELAREWVRKTYGLTLAANSAISFDTAEFVKLVAAFARSLSIPRQKGEVDMETVIDIRAAIIELMGTGVKVPTTEELIAYMATSPSNSNP